LDAPRLTLQRLLHRWHNDGLGALGIGMDAVRHIAVPRRVIRLAVVKIEPLVIGINEQHTLVGLSYFAIALIVLRQLRALIGMNADAVIHRLHDNLDVLALALVLLGGPGADLVDHRLQVGPRRLLGNLVLQIGVVDAKIDKHRVRVVFGQHVGELAHSIPVIGRAGLVFGGRTTHGAVGQRDLARKSLPIEPIAGGLKPKPPVHGSQTGTDGGNRQVLAVLQPLEDRAPGNRRNPDEDNRQGKALVSVVNCCLRSVSSKKCDR